jgi:hypothetical protein
MDAAMLTIVTAAFSDLKDVVVDVLTVAVPSIVGIICISKGIQFALRKVASVLSWA